MIGHSIITNKGNLLLYMLFIISFFLKQQILYNCNIIIVFYHYCLHCYVWVMDLVLSVFLVCTIWKHSSSLLRCCHSWTVCIKFSSGDSMYDAPRNCCLKHVTCHVFFNGPVFCKRAPVTICVLKCFIVCMNLRH